MADNWGLLDTRNAWWWPYVPPGMRQALFGGNDYAETGRPRAAPNGGLLALGSEFSTGADVRDYTQSTQNAYDNFKKGAVAQGLLDTGYAGAALAMTALPGSASGVRQVVEDAGGAVSDALRRGLPMDEASRMSRAESMGFTRPVWHETSGENVSRIFEFDPHRPGAGQFDERMPHGVFTKSTPASIGVTRDAPAQMPLLARPGVSRKFGSDADLVRHLMQDESYRNLATQYQAVDKKYAAEFDRMFAGYDGAVSSDADIALDALLDEWQETVKPMQSRLRELATDFFRREGVDSIEIASDAGSFGRKTDTFLVLDPRNIRSRFADFDPTKSDSANIMAGAIPLGLLSVGGYGLLSGDEEPAY